MPSSGSKGRLNIKGSNLSQYLTSVGLSMEREAAAVARFGDESVHYIPGLKDANIAFGGPMFSESVDMLWDLLDSGEVVIFEYSPQGLGTQTFAGYAFVKEVAHDSSTDDPNSVSGSIQVTGDVLRYADMDYNDPESEEFWDFDSDDPNAIFIDGNELSTNA